MAPESPLNSPTFFLSSHLQSICPHSSIVRIFRLRWNCLEPPFVIGYTYKTRQHKGDKVMSPLAIISHLDMFLSLYLGFFEAAPGDTCASSLYQNSTVRPQTTSDTNIYVKKRSDLGRGNTLNWKRASPLKKRVGINLIPVTVIASKTRFNWLYAKSSRASTLICLSCCVILTCCKVGTWDSNCVIQMTHWIAKFLLLIISIHKYRGVSC